MNALDIATFGCAVAMLASVYHIARGPSAADRAVAADLLTFSLVALVALFGVQLGRTGTFDIVLMATLVAFLAAVSLSRALSGGRR